MRLLVPHAGAPQDALAIITEVARLHEAGQPAAAALQQLPSAWRAQ